MDIEEAKKQLLKHKKEIDEKYISARYSKAIEVLLNELDKKDKIIDLMARAIDNYDSQLEICTFKNKEHVREYFTNKVEEDK